MLAVQQIPYSDAVAGDFVNVGRTNALAGSADGAAAAGFLLQLVQQDVIGHDYVGAVADVKPAGINTPLLQSGHFPQQNVGIHHYPIADDAGYSRPANSRRHQVQLEFAAFVHHRVTGVIAAGVADNAIGFTGKVIDHLALTLVAPLSSDYGISRHCAPLQKAPN